MTGIIFTYRQIREGYKTQKATFLKELYSMMVSDPDIIDAFYQIEYGKFVYDEDFHGSHEERVVDRLLSFCDLVCDLYKQKIITEHEMSFFKYRFTRVYKNQHIRNYLAFLEGFYELVETGTKPFRSFTTYCKSVLTNG